MSVFSLCRTWSLFFSYLLVSRPIGAIFEPYTTHMLSIFRGLPSSRRAEARNHAGLAESASHKSVCRAERRFDIWRGGTTSQLLSLVINNDIVINILIIVSITAITMSMITCFEPCSLDFSKNCTCICCL